MHVAMLTTVGDRCGIASYTRALVAGLEALPGVTVEVVPITEGRQATEHYRGQAERLNAPGVDVVHIQHEYSFWGGVLPGSTGFWELRYLVQKPVVLTAHTTLSLEELFRIRSERAPHKWLAKQFLLRRRAYRETVEAAPFVTALTIVHTAAARNTLVARGAKPEHVTIIPTGIPDAAPAPDGGAAFRARFGLEGKRLLTLFGYVTTNKGYELVLDALPALPDDVVFVIAGGPRVEREAPYLESLRAEIEARGLARRVAVTGFLPDGELPGALAASELVLVPHTQATGSYSVSFPLAHGCALLASDLDCFREISARLDCLELFRAGDGPDFAAKLSALLGDPARRDALRRNALRYAARFSWPRVAALTRDVYREAVAVYTSGPQYMARQWLAEQSDSPPP